MSFRLFIVLFVFPLTSFTQPFDEVEDLAKAYVHALKRMETSSFQKLYASNTTELSRNMNTNLGFIYQDLLVQDFTNTIKEGLDKGIDWNKIKFIKVEYITKKDGPFLIAQPCVVYFQHRLFRYAIHMNASKIDGSWGFVPYLDKNDRIEMKKI